MSTTYGCHNTVRRNEYEVPVRKYDHRGKLLPGTHVEVIQDRSTVACQYDLRTQDPKCHGCIK